MFEFDKNMMDYRNFVAVVSAKTQEDLDKVHTRMVNQQKTVLRTLFDKKSSLKNFLLYLSILPTLKKLKSKI